MNRSRTIHYISLQTKSMPLTPLGNWNFYPSGSYGRGWSRARRKLQTSLAQCVLSSQLYGHAIVLKRYISTPCCWRWRTTQKKINKLTTKALREVSLDGVAG